MAEIKDVRNNVSLKQSVLKSLQEVPIIMFMVQLRKTVRRLEKHVSIHIPILDPYIALIDKLRAFMFLITMAGMPCQKTKQNKNKHKQKTTTTNKQTTTTKKKQKKKKARQTRGALPSPSNASECKEVTLQRK